MSTGLQGALVDVIGTIIAPLAARVAVLEQERMKGVDNVRWAGVYKKGETIVAASW